MLPFAKRVYRAVIDAGQGWLRHNAIRLAAAISFYTAIALAPLLTMILYIAGIFWGAEAAAGYLVDQIANLTDRTSADFIQNLIAEADRAGSGPLASAFSFVVLIWGSTRLFSQLQDALNVIWDVDPQVERMRKRITRFARQRLLAFGMTLVVAFILLISLVFDAIISYASAQYDLPGKDWLWGSANSVILLAIVWMLFTFIYKVLPFRSIRFRDAMVGAAVAALLFTLGKQLFALYLVNQSSVYGASGSLLAILLWVYFSAQALFFGAEMARAWRKSGQEDQEPKDS